MLGGNSFTIAHKSPGGELGKAAPPTRLRRQSNASDEVIPPPSSHQESVVTAPPVAQEKVSEKVEQSIKQNRKASYRLISQELARSKAESSSASRLVATLVQELNDENAVSAPDVTSFAGGFNQERRGSIESIDSISSSVLMSEPDPLGPRMHDKSSSKLQVGGSALPTDTDLLASMMAMSKVAKRMAYRKRELEGIVQRLQQHVAELEREKAELFAQLESLAKRMRVEKTNASQALTELKIKFKRRIEEAEEEAANSKLAAGFLQGSNKRLMADVEHLEVKLMEVPRMEETYMRTARDIVKQRDVLLNEKDVKIRGMSNEIEQVSFWKQKATLYNEELARKDKEATIQKRQMIMIAHNYRQMAKRNTQLQKDVVRLSKQRHPGSSSNSSNLQTGRGQSPSGRSSPIQFELEDEDEQEGADDAKGLDDLIEKMERAERTGGRSQAAKGESQGPTFPIVKSAAGPSAATVAATGQAQTQNQRQALNATATVSDEDFNLKEIKRLRGIIAQMRDEREKLHLKLSQARAYPLLHTKAQGGGDKLDYATRFIGQVYVSEMDELFDDPEPGESDAEDAAAADRRIEKALSSQRDFQNRLDEIRTKRPSTTTAASFFRKGK